MLMPTGPASKGLHRVSWGLRYGTDMGRGPYAVPGKYTVEVAQRANDETKQLSEAKSFEVVSAMNSTLEPQDREATLAFQMEMGELQRKAIGAGRKLSEAMEQLDEIKSVLKRSRTADPAIYDQARAIEKRMLAIDRQLNGDSIKDERSQLGQVSIMSRLQTALFGTMGQTYGPTNTHREQFAIASNEFKKLRPELRKVLDQEMSKLMQTLDEAGVAWTSGRKLPE